ncbi:MAG TPA: extensin family protein [Rhizobiales bacterium]|nr:extensin family protein [Hyphomicrobiales bacterium]
MSMRLTSIICFLCILTLPVASQIRFDNNAITGEKHQNFSFRLDKKEKARKRSKKNTVVANPLGLPYVPLPRPRPLPGQTVLTYQNPNKPKPLIKEDRRGEVSIVLERLDRERDQKTARNLRPTLRTSWSPAQVKKALDRCKLVLATTNIDADILAPIGGSGGCGIAAPVLVRSFGAIKIKPAAKLNCNLALATYKWLVDKVQPMARKRYKSPLVSVRQLSSYSCRSRRGSGTSRISEHSFGNALDVASFTFANGKTVSLLKDWSTLGAQFGIGQAANFLADAHKMACASYATVLSPRYNKAHANHFHMDMGRGGRYKICK